jgi:hypothetical protein
LARGVAAAQSPLHLKEPPLHTHPEIDARSLALHRLVAAKLRRNPQLLQGARQTLGRWRTVVDAASQPYLRQWEAAVEQGLDACLNLCEEDSARATALRQCSPLGAVLTAKERFLFLKFWRPEHEPASP